MLIRSWRPHGPMATLMRSLWYFAWLSRKLVPNSQPRSAQQPAGEQGNHCYWQCLHRGQGIPVWTLAPSEPGNGTSKSVLQYRMFSAQL